MAQKLGCRSLITCKVCRTTGSFLQASGSTSQDPAVLRAHRAGPDHVKIVRSKPGQWLPGTDVGQDCGVGLGVDVKRHDFPAQLLEGSALPIEPVPENNSSRRRGIGDFFFHDGVKG